MTPAAPVLESSDVVLIGSGIMAANLGALLKKLDPSLSIQLFEVTEELAQEASNGWNNAGTGHAGLCELSYTPGREANGSVSAANPIKIFEQFEHSKQFWAHAVETGMIPRREACINPVPHLSFVHGQTQVDFLRDRHAAMSAHHFFADMEFSTDREQIRSWAPLLIDQRDPSQPVAATRCPHGSDINFGEIARSLLGWLGEQENCRLHTHHRVIGLDELADGRWLVTAQNLDDGQIVHTTAKFVFIGAGGGSLPLLQKAGIPQAQGLGGFPIGGGWLVCSNPEVVEQHQAKVYGQAQEEAPTMAVPHLDSRMLDGQKQLLFGPFAAFTTKFLHQKGKVTDLPASIRPHNLLTLTKIGVTNLGLIRYLMKEGTQSMEGRLKVLRRFYPAAKKADWRYQEAGIRVQAIKKTDGEAGIVHYGTEIISNTPKTISALLGASPGASVSVNIVLGVIKECFAGLLQRPEVQERLSECIPSWNQDLKDPAHADRFRELHAHCDRVLGLR